MSPRAVSAALRQRVAEAARFRCGYCLTPQRIIGPLLEIDHIISEARGGTSDEENLWLACLICNGPRLTGRKHSIPKGEPWFLSSIPALSVGKSILNSLKSAHLFMARHPRDVLHCGPTDEPSRYSSRSTSKGDCRLASSDGIKCPAVCCLKHWGIVVGIAALAMAFSGTGQPASPWFHFS
jgi:HNH endonuclease